MENKKFTNKFVELLKNGTHWTREDTLKAYDYLHGAFYDGEVDISEKNYSDIRWGVIHLLDILNGESAFGKHGVQREFRSSLYNVGIRLNVISKEDEKEIDKCLYGK